jgi:NTE family protein
VRHERIQHSSERPDFMELAARGCRTTMHIAHIIAPDAADEDPLMDIDFVPRNIRTRWQAGYRDAQAIVVHDAVGTM